MSKQVSQKSLAFFFFKQVGWGLSHSVFLRQEGMNAKLIQ